MATCSAVGSGGWRVEDLDGRLGAVSGPFPDVLVAVGLAGLILLAKEDAAVVVAPFALYMWWRWKEARVEVYMAPNPFQRQFYGADGVPELPDVSVIEYLAVDPRKTDDGLDPMLEVIVSDDWEVIQADTFVLARRR